MMLDTLKTLIEGVTGLGGRVEEALELAELVRKGALPPSPVAAYVVPLGLRPRSEGDAAAGAFIQAVDEVLGVVLVLRTGGDVSGKKTAPKLDTLIWAVIEAVAGNDPGETVPGVFVFRGGRLVSLSAGLVLYQIDFAVQLQIRIT